MVKELKETLRLLTDAIVGTFIDGYKVCPPLFIAFWIVLAGDCYLVFLAS